MKKEDIVQLKIDYDIVEVIGRYVELHPKGSEYKGMCPWHEDSSPSLNVNDSKQVWMCPACSGDRKGDVLDFIKQYFNVKLPEAIAILKNEAYQHNAPDKIKLNKPKKQKLQPWTHLSTKNECSVFYNWRLGDPAWVYTYRGADGSLIGYVCRFEFNDEQGKPTKETLPLIWASSPDGKYKDWRWQGFNESVRVVYNAHLVAKYPTLPIIVVEGEKAADWLNDRLNNKAIAVTWVGGSNQVDKTNFDLLNGRDVILWPDNDAPGKKCMEYVDSQIQSKNKKWFIMPKGVKKGWDAADSGWSAKQVQDYVRRAFRKPVVKKHSQDETHFTYMGFEKSDNSPLFVFYCKKSKTIFRLSASSMTKSNLMCLAPLNWWEKHFAGFKNTEAAANLLINTSYTVGIYSPKNVRGRGAWFDDGRVVIHAGDKLIVDGEETILGDLDTHYIYEIGESFNFSTQNPLTIDKAKKLLDITRLLNWERGINADLLAGWCVVASVCGALRWRPHIWLTGSAGTGKSWVFRNVVRRMLGETALDVQGATTEAGLRQTLGFDAIPVVFDEIDGNDKKSADRIQETLELARSASADDTGRIIKGSAAHSAKEFQIRSCFAFASIAIGVDKGSDRRRVTTLSLSIPRDLVYKASRWHRLSELHSQIIDDDYVSSLQARTIGLLPVILQNASTFTMAVVSVLGGQALGDQLGPMLAGAYSLQSDDVISLEDAVKYVSEQDWNEETQAEEMKDEVELLHNLLDWMVRVDGWGERPIGELVNICVENKTPSIAENLTPAVADARLRRSGVRVEGDFIYFSTKSSEIKSRLKDTRWSTNYGIILRRIEGAQGGKMRFIGGSDNCVKVPTSILK